MELALNLAWLFLAIASLLALAVWRRFSPATSKPLRVSEWHTLVAVCCALVILFFVISMTDDLHDQQIASEDSQSRKLVLADQDSRGKHVHHVDFSYASCLLPEPEPLSATDVGRVAPLAFSHSGIGRTAPLSGRDPPFFRS